MTRRGQGWCGAAVVAGLALAFPPAAPAATAVGDSVGQVVGELNGQVQGLTGQPAPVLPAPPSIPGNAPPSRPAAPASAPSPAPAPAHTSYGGGPAPDPVARSSRASGPARPRLARDSTASPSARAAAKGEAHSAATSSDPTDATLNDGTRPVSEVVKPSGDQDGALPFTGWKPLPLIVLGLVSFGLGLGLLRIVRARRPGRPRESQT